MLIDADPSSVIALRRALVELSFDVQVELTGRNGLETVASIGADIVLVDQSLPDMSGVEVIKRLKQVDDTLPVILLQEMNQPAATIQAFKLGAFDCLPKPLEPSRLRRRIGDAVRSQEPESKSTVKVSDSWEDEDEAILGSCPVMRNIWREVGCAARTDSCVLLRGEPGTGKFTLAKYLHRQSDRCQKPVSHIDCQAFSPSSLESELFGSNSDRGTLNCTPGGTVILRNIDALPTNLQARLANYITQADHPRRNDSTTGKCRIFAVTSQNLEKMVREGDFLSELYYLLLSCSINQPPLRLRQGDLPSLVHSSLNRIVQQIMPGKRVPEISHDAMRTLVSHTWPGNLEELHSVLSQAVVAAPGPMITANLVHIQADSEGNSAAARSDRNSEFQTHWDTFADLRIDAGTENLYEQAMIEADRKLLARVLHHTSGNQAMASRILGITRTSLRKKLRLAGLMVQQIVEPSESVAESTSS